MIRGKLAGGRHQLRRRGGWLGNSSAEEGMAQWTQTLWLRPTGTCMFRTEPLGPKRLISVHPIPDCSSQFQKRQASQRLFGYQHHYFLLILKPIASWTLHASQQFGVFTDQRPTGPPTRSTLLPSGLEQVKPSCVFRRCYDCSSLFFFFDWMYMFVNRTLTRSISNLLFELLLYFDFGVYSLRVFGKGLHSD